MATYAFETITDEQARAFKPGDILTIDGSGADVRVSYFNYPPGLLPVVPQIDLTAGGRTVRFGTELADGSVAMSDGSVLHVGDLSDEQADGSAGRDGLYGGPGHDTLNGAAGDDRLQGNTGDDVLNGGAGSNSVYGGQGHDTISASEDDRGAFAQGNLGDDRIEGGDGGDTLLGGQGHDHIVGGRGSDYVSGDLGDDSLWASAPFSDPGGADTLAGGGGNDRLHGGFGAGDLLDGGDGNDLLIGRGASTLRGGAGDDTLMASGADAAELSGGAGRDLFVIEGRPEAISGGYDRILDWDAEDTLSLPPPVRLDGPAPQLSGRYSEATAADQAAADAIADQHIAAAGSQWVAVQVGSDVIVYADWGDPANGADIAVVLVGRSLADIDAGDFA